MIAEVCFLYVTAPTSEEALDLGRTMVAERLAACANVHPGTTSVYWWAGEIQEESEAVLILKTRADLAEKATARIRELHSYECPCVVILPIAGGNREFLDWIIKETS